MQVTSHEPGKFCWAELITSDGAGAKAFYKALFGYEYFDIPMGPDGAYTIAQLNGQSAAGLYEDKSEHTRWGTYISVENVDAAAAKAADLGGKVIGGPMDVMTAGRMAVLQDPTGAYFQVWQAGTSPGFTVVGEPGAVCWNELSTRDTAAAEAFYSGLFGYGIKHSDIGGQQYTELQLDGKSVAGISGMQAQDQGIPPHWLVIFMVTKCDDTVAAAQQNGGTLLAGPMAIPGVGNFAVLADPQGAAFGVVD